ncbi:MAG: DUF72 domain-containing protein [Candidatus Nanopelagicales bacterium]
MTVHIGVSGWSYPRWRGDFYPRVLRPGAELGYVAARMPAAEVNATFYRLQRPTTFRAWSAVGPDGFRLALKGPRYITHLKRLRGCRVPLANFLASGPLLLGNRLGPLLWQLPARQEFDAETVGSFLGLLPHDTAEAAALAAQHDGRREDVSIDADAVRPLRHVLEARHASFASPEAGALLAACDVGSVVADTAGRFPSIEHVTSGVVYVRLHGHERLYSGGYDDALLDRWAQRCRAWSEGGRDVWVFFDNDADGRAPYDAIALTDRLRDLLPECWAVEAARRTG